MSRSPKQSSRGLHQPPRLLLLTAPVPALSLWGRHVAGGASPEPRRGGTAAMQLLASLARGSGQDNFCCGWRRSGLQPAHRMGLALWCPAAQPPQPGSTAGSQSHRTTGWFGMEAAWKTTWFQPRETQIQPDCDGHGWWGTGPTAASSTIAMPLVRRLAWSLKSPKSLLALIFMAPTAEGGKFADSYPMSKTARKLPRKMAVCLNTNFI